MTDSPERKRGDQWAAKLRDSGCWVQKLPASSMAGLPDWIVGKIRTDPHQNPPRFVEAKTFEAVQDAKGKAPREACTTAQKFFLDRWSKSGGWASVLILAEDGWVEISIESAHLPMKRREFDVIKRGYE